MNFVSLKKISNNFSEATVAEKFADKRSRKVNQLWPLKSSSEACQDASENVRRCCAQSVSCVALRCPKSRASDDELRSQDDNLGDVAEGEKWKTNKLPRTVTSLEFPKAH